MPSCCCLLPSRCCCPSKTKTKTDEQTEITKTNAKTILPKPKHKSTIAEQTAIKIDEIERKLKRVQRYGTGTVQVIAGAFMITIIMWLLVRVPEPQVHVTKFEVEALTPQGPKTSKKLNYNITVHNPDLFKYLHYDVLIARINYPTFIAPGYTIDFINGEDKQFSKENGFSQRPDETTLLSNYTITADWNFGTFRALIEPFKYNISMDYNYIGVQFVMEVNVRAFNKVITKRQVTRSGDIYFRAYNITDDKDGKYIGGPYGEAFIPHGGLRLS